MQTRLLPALPVMASVLRNCLHWSIVSVGLSQLKLPELAGAVVTFLERMAAHPVHVGAVMEAGGLELAHQAQLRLPDHPLIKATVGKLVMLLNRA